MIRRPDLRALSDPTAIGADYGITSRCTCSPTASF